MILVSAGGVHLVKLRVHVTLVRVCLIHNISPDGDITWSDGVVHGIMVPRKSSHIQIMIL